MQKYMQIYYRHIISQQTGIDWLVPFEILCMVS